MLWHQLRKERGSWHIAMGGSGKTDENLWRLWCKTKSDQLLLKIEIWFWKLQQDQLKKCPRHLKHEDRALPILSRSWAVLVNCKQGRALSICYLWVFEGLMTSTCNPFQNLDWGCLKKKPSFKSEPWNKRNWWRRQSQRAWEIQHYQNTDNHCSVSQTMMMRFETYWVCRRLNGPRSISLANLIFLRIVKTAWLSVWIDCTSELALMHFVEPSEPTLNIPELYYYFWQ